MTLNFEKGNGLLPAIIQDYFTNKILMLGFMDKQSFEKSKETGKVTFFSRTKNRQWVKGESSGNFLMIKEIMPDCDNDTLLIKVQPTGPVCHTGSDNCFGDLNKTKNSFLYDLEKIIENRKNNPSKESYTSGLLQKSINKVAQKVGEEAVELVIEAKDNNKELFLNEAADLIFHFLVLLRKKEILLSEVENILEKRHSDAIKRK